MLEKIRHLIGRFPDREDNIRELWQTNAAFESLAHQHSEVSGCLHRLSGGDPETSHNAEILRRRQAALEEEMLIIMDQSSRV
jgi:uncharacterized protein YdcH (DUF465 family)